LAEIASNESLSMFGEAIKALLTKRKSIVWEDYQKLVALLSEITRVAVAKSGQASNSDTQNKCISDNDNAFIKRLMLILLLWNINFLNKLVTTGEYHDSDYVFSQNTTDQQWSPFTDVLSEYINL
jgi:hypothetical protein